MWTRYYQQVAMEHIEGWAEQQHWWWGQAGHLTRDTRASTNYYPRQCYSNILHPQDLVMLMQHIQFTQILHPMSERTHVPLSSDKAGCYLLFTQPNATI